MARCIATELCFGRVLLVVSPRHGACNIYQVQEQREAYRPPEHEPGEAADMSTPSNGHSISRQFSATHSEREFASQALPDLLALCDDQRLLILRQTIAQIPTR
jgi:hypothetical protein